MIKIQIDDVDKFIKIATANYTKWLQKWIIAPYVFRRHQPGDVSQIHSNLLCYYAVSFWPVTEQFRIHLCPSFEQHSYKQYYKWIRNRFRNALVKMSNQIEMTNGLATSLVPVQDAPKRNAVRPNESFSMKSWILLY